MPAGLTAAEYFRRASARHGDKYDYSRSSFTKTNASIKIVCREHGPFEIRAAKHLYFSGGCPVCAENDRQAAYVARCREVHGDKYEYSSTVYRTMHDKVTILCPVHGKFQQNAQSHVNGKGCRKCGGTNKSSAEEFIRRAREVHGDLYDYSKVEYKSARQKVRIICPMHGEFLQVPYSHLIGNGCAVCAGTIRKTTQQFVDEAKAIHGDKYDYSEVEYHSANDKVKIVCPEHGSFEQTPGKHIGDKSGCPKCGGVTAGLKRRIGETEFVRRATEIHGSKYDYSKVCYKTSTTPVEIICPEHGSFLQTPADHVYNKSGCSDCGAAIRGSLKSSIAKSTFVKRAREVHGSKYIYKMDTYRGASTPMEIVCPDHGVFMQQPGNHLYGNGCPSCAEYGFKGTEPAILYYVRIDADEGTYYKIGITNRTIEDRFRTDFVRMTVIKSWMFESGDRARKREREILTTFKDELIEGGDVLRFGGNSELFYRDVLDLDPSRPFRANS